MSCEVEDDGKENESPQQIRAGVPYVIQQYRVRVQSAPSDIREWCCMMSYKDCRVLWTQIYIFIVVSITVFTLGSLVYWIYIEPAGTTGTLFDHHQISDSTKGGTGKYQQEVDTDTDTDTDEGIGIIHDYDYKSSPDNHYILFGYDLDEINISPLYYMLIQSGILLFGCFVCICCTICGGIGYEFIQNCKVKMERWDNMMNRLLPDPKQVALRKLEHHENVHLI